MVAPDPRRPDPQPLHPPPTDARPYVANQLGREARRPKAVEEAPSPYDHSVSEEGKDPFRYMLEGGMQPVHFMRAWGMDQYAGFMMGTAIGYLTRSRMEPANYMDVDKAIHILQMLREERKNYADEQERKGGGHE